jgi:hypothetical protein
MPNGGLEKRRFNNNKMCFEAVLKNIQKWVAWFVAKLFCARLKKCAKRQAKPALDRAR